jgi:glycosyltransferase involved in cell wall biosynthesis
MIIINNFKTPMYVLFDYHLTNNISKNLIDKNGYIFLLCSWYKSSNIINLIKQYFDYNIILLANSIEEKIFFEKKVTCDVLFCNHNAFLNENIYNITDISINNNLSRKYELVVDSAFHGYKNVYLANKIKNTLHIGYNKQIKEHIGDNVIPDYGILANYIKKGTYERLNKPEINKYYNECLIAGIFSEVEGACFASSQYLLAGLPVISTKSVGGRDIWYNENNSIICENNEDSVYEALELAKKKLINGEFNRFDIRNAHLKQMDEHRTFLIEYIKNKLLLDNELIDIMELKSKFSYF